MGKTGNLIIEGDSRELVKLLAPNSLHCCVTSPPYFGLRDYGHKAQLGQENTPKEFIDNLVKVFDFVKLALRDDGVLWVNLGDSYAPNKSLLGLPWRFALAMQEAGWILRQDIIWHKPNPMPESVRDRCTKAHEYIFMFVKNPSYYFDHEAMKEPASKGAAGSTSHKGKTAEHQQNRASVKEREVSAMRNRRSVWPVTTKPFKGAHCATFPPDLIQPCIASTTSAGGCCAACGAPYRRIVENGAVDRAHQMACGADSSGEYHGVSTKDYASAKAQDASATKARILAGMVKKITVGWEKPCDCATSETKPCLVFDPFGGAGTTALVANKLGQDALLFEASAEYVRIARERLANGI